MNIFISTGEVSGDLQGSMLVTALRQQAQAQNIPLQISALGGERMAAAGAELLGNTAAIGSIGILESIPFIIPTWLMQRRAKKHLRENPPDLLILIDYMGPNLSLGAFFRRHLPDIPIVYYIAPQTWVWSPGNQAIEQIVAITDKMLAIFPGAAKFFAERGVSVDWVGHPLIDRLQEAPSRTEARKALNLPADKQVVALFPASRYQELKYLLPIICQAAQQLQEKLPELHFVIATSLPDYREQIESAIQAAGITATIVNGRSLEVMAAADLAIAKSGTVNLELALLKIPQVVLFLGNPLTLWIARNLLKFSIPFMSPVNLVVMREIVPELFQEEATAERIAEESLNFLLNESRRQQLSADYDEMRSQLGENGVCQRAADKIIELALNPETRSK